MNKELVIYGAIGTLGAAMGFGGGYILAKTKFRRIADEEIASVKHSYSELLNKKPDLEKLAERYEDGQEAVEEAAELVERLDLGVPVQEARVRTEFVDEVAEKAQQDFEKERNVLEENSDEQAAKPNALEPYVISNESWSEGSWDHHDKASLTYYASDDILADEADQVYDEVDSLIGKSNLTRFGYLSEDPDIVYVRNERISVDFEITRVTGSYFETVHNSGK